MKKLAWLAVGSVLAVAFAVFPATAGSEHVPFHLGGGTCGPPPAPTGPVVAPNSFVMLNTPGKPFTANDVIANIQLKDGLPNTTYDIWVYGPANCGDVPPNGGTLTTNSNGHGHSNVKVSGTDLAGGPHPFQVQLNQQPTGFPVEFTSETAFLD